MMRRRVVADYLQTLTPRRVSRRFQLCVSALPEIALWIRWKSKVAQSIAFSIQICCAHRLEGLKWATHERLVWLRETVRMGLHSGSALFLSRMKTLVPI
jgi:hypothetical protein